MRDEDVQNLLEVLFCSRYKVLSYVTKADARRPLTA